MQTTVMYTKFWALPGNEPGIPYTRIKGIDHVLDNTASTSRGGSRVVSQGGIEAKVGRKGADFARFLDLPLTSMIIKKGGKKSLKSQVHNDYVQKQISSLPSSAQTEFDNWVDDVTAVWFSKTTSRKKSAGLLCSSHI